jgi:NAD(P)-dependent dehydrogenase (short-subunit alcohol dehydrogenase family)
VAVAPDDLSGTVALVTGGAHGIGFEIARELTTAGARVAISARSRDRLEEAARELGAFAVAGDVASEEDVARVVEQTERTLGQVDLLVANAGVDDRHHIATVDSDPAQWWHVFTVNVLGTYLTCRAVLPGMIRRRKGRIIVLSSGASYLPVTPSPEASAANYGFGLPAGTAPNYGASKAAIGRFAEYLAAEGAPNGISVFAITPGFVRTGMTVPEFPDNTTWTPIELAPRLVRVLASGRADRLSGRYLHSQFDDVEALIRRADEVVENDLQTIRLRR